MDQSNTGQKAKKDPLNKHLLSTFKDVTDFINELGQLNKKQIMLIAKRNELLADGEPVIQEEQELDEIEIKKKSVLNNLRVKLDKQFSYLLITPEKYFMRFNWKYLDMNQQVREFINNFALEKGLKVKLIDDDLVVYTQVDTGNNFSINVTIREANVRNPDRVHIQEEIQETPLQVEQIDVVSLLPPDPIRDVIIEADSREDAPKYQICLKFKSPDDCGHPIDNYRVVLVDKDQGQFLPKLTIIKEFFLLGDFQSVYLQFGNDISFNQVVTIQLQAHNQVGWSLVESNILIQHNHPKACFLYIQGVNLISVEAQTQIMEINLNENDDDMQDHFTPINFEIVNFSTKFNNYALVDPSFRVCQWGEVLVNNEDVLAIDFDPETSLRKKLDPFLMIVDPFHLSENRYPIVKLACGKYHTLGVTVDGKLISWGLNAYGQLGIGSTTSILIPNVVKMDKFIQDVVATKYGSGCLDIDGNTYSWGQRQDRYEGADCVTNRFNEVINYQCSNKHTFYDRPRQLGLRAKYIGAGWNSFIAISIENWVYQWGENQFFEFGQGHNKDEDLGYIYHLLNPMNMNVQCDELRIGAHHIIIRQGNKFLSWGWNNKGQCGQNEEKDFLKRGQVQLPENNYKDFSCGFNHSSFLTEDNKIIQFGMPNATIQVNADSIHSGTNCTFILGNQK